MTKECSTLSESFLAACTSMHSSGDILGEREGVMEELEDGDESCDRLSHGPEMTPALRNSQQLWRPA